MPDFLTKKLESFYEGLSHCIEADYGIGEHPYEPTLGHSGTEANHLCKTSKVQSIKTTVNSIRERVEKWLEHANQDESLQALKALFSQEDTKKIDSYVPRCKSYIRYSVASLLIWITILGPVFVHIFAAITQMSCSSYYHLFGHEN